MLVKQAANVLELLEFYANRRKPASVAEVSQHFGWPRSSTFNILSTLSSRGYLFEPESRGRFYPTPRWLTVAQEFSAAEPLSENLLNLVQEVAERTKETVCIAGPSGLQAVFLEVIPSPSQIRYAAEVGGCLPIHATATGQAILSQFPDAQRASILRKVVFEHYASGSPMSIEAVEDSIRRSLHRGWFTSSSAFSQDLGGTSIPLVIGGRILAITVAGPVSRIQDKVDDFGRILHEATALHLGSDFIAKNVKGLHEPAREHFS
jgi:DNA-binding IclR family transcriptional regulator